MSGLHSLYRRDRCSKNMEVLSINMKISRREFPVSEGAKSITSVYRTDNTLSFLKGSVAKQSLVRSDIECGLIDLLIEIELR